MRNIVFLNLIQNNTNSQIHLMNGKSLSTMIQDFTSTLPDVEKIIPIALDIEQLKMFYSSKDPEDYVILSENRQDLLLQAMDQAAAGYDQCIYFFGDTPLLDIDLFNKMYAKHLKYYADYSFADGFPGGLAAEIINPHTLNELNKLITECSDPIKRESLFSWIQKDINSFDIETEISEVDLRLNRISLAADNKINLMQLQAFIKAGIIRARDFMDHHNKLESFTRTAPNYYQIQISAACPQSCSYCPYPEMNTDHLTDSRQMAPEKVIELALAIEAYTPDAVVSLSLWGEPSLYTNIYELLEHLLENTELSFVIETSGVGWTDLDDAGIQKIISSQRIEWIFSLDTLNPELYRRLRDKGQAEALSTAEYFLKLNPSHTWIQAIRMKENEDDLEQFYRHWKEKTDNVIIQKYDHFSKSLPEKKITDLSPLKRFPCWHLKREMSIQLDGNVLLCCEDLKQEATLGNCFTDKLEKIWEAGDSRFSEHLDEKYCGICEHCDEYYSFNF
ncbi:MULTISPECIES: spiro-SPASM protein [unclassified Oceanispirochaeta]|uniref:spiro-SPASM protein n=1 Tax=unclassified Oceanispirochaeta TaxID=2635722 RepID=UPI000E09A166|nr:MULTISPECIES: spiro-SPASM protein [unclassified Oceanispirochaeta]MBF9017666.1 spiro-SPASM protein [Oceanispirochaeta sp. M2]NPD74238.1 spiro-SPASM protein [Oceanispirochaeta sp. M1]RDG29944.1 spiro-SPASM protein [Oceanispirochaeta sp. M1]